VACVKNDKYAVQRVVDVMRAENGQIYLLMEYLGYQYLEARPESWLEDMGRLGVYGPIWVVCR
jgi:hypothetical protein